MRHLRCWDGWRRCQNKGACGRGAHNEVLETDVAKIPDGAEIPHQLEVCVCGNGIVFE
jgi:hypothetical protein